MVPEITGRAVRRFGSDRPVDRISAAELRVWLLELRETLAPESIAGYVRGLKAFGNWCNAEELAGASGFRALRRPHVPHKLVAPFSTGELERLLALADPRERALTLLLLDTGLRLAEVTSLRVGDLRSDGTIRVLGKGSKERIVPLGRTARRAPPPLCGGARSRRPGGPAVRRPLRRAAQPSRHPVCSRAARPAGGRRHPIQPPHVPPHLRPRYLVNGGDVFSLQQILGHATLDMVRRYISLTEADLVARHRAALPADRLAGARR